MEYIDPSNLLSSGNNFEKADCHCTSRGKYECFGFKV